MPAAPSTSWISSNPDHTHPSIAPPLQSGLHIPPYGWHPLATRLAIPNERKSSWETTAGIITYRWKIPAPAPNSVLDLYARWSSFGSPSPNPYDLQGGIHEYRLAIKPTEEIWPGRRIRLLALTQIAYYLPKVPIGQYDTYDPHVVGLVSDVTTRWEIVPGSLTRKRRTTVRVENECRGNAVVVVDLEIPEDDGDMTREDNVRHVEAAVRPTLPAERSERGGRRGRKRRRRSSESQALNLDLLASIRPWPTWGRQCGGSGCYLQAHRIL
ncbi:hypothetical protein C8T65DRAFT_693184 [Cerioporus squamosus]|nr:hypothetical protein C8T65DRAFT_693184 [Cerioporus squamosus]